MTSNTTPTTKTRPVIDPASLANLPDNYRMNEFEACAYLGLSVHTIRMWRFKGSGPAYLKLSRAVRYCKADLDAYLTQSSVRPQA